MVRTKSSGKKKMSATRRSSRIKTGSSSENPKPSSPVEIPSSTDQSQSEYYNSPPRKSFYRSSAEIEEENRQINEILEEITLEDDVENPESAMIEYNPSMAVVAPVPIRMIRAEDCVPNFENQATASLGSEIFMSAQESVSTGVDKEEELGVDSFVVYSTRNNAVDTPIIDTPMDGSEKPSGGGMSRDDNVVSEGEPIPIVIALAQGEQKKGAEVEGESVPDEVTLAQWKQSIKVGISEGKHDGNSVSTEVVSSSEDEYEVVPPEEEVDISEDEHSEDIPQTEGGANQEKGADSPSWTPEKAPYSPLWTSDEDDTVVESSKTSKKRKRESTVPTSGRTLRSQTKSPAATSSKKLKVVTPASKKKSIQEDDTNAVGEIFVNTAAKRFWKSFASTRRFNVEKVLDLEIDEFKLKDLLSDSHLLFSATGHLQFVETIVKEFYCNMPAGVNDPESDDYQKVYVRGNYYTLSPELLCDAFQCWNSDDKCEESFDQIAFEITGEQRTVWKIDGYGPRPSELSSKYAALHKVAMSNWMPVRHTNFVSQKLGSLLFKAGTMISFDLGQMAYDQICEFAGQKEKISVYVFPCTIFRLLTAQGLITRETEIFTQPDSLKLTSRLTGGDHVVDIDNEDMNIEGLQQPIEGLEDDPKAAIRSTIQFLTKQEYQFKKKRLALEALLAKM